MRPSSPLSWLLRSSVKLRSHRVKTLKCTPALFISSLFVTCLVTISVILVLGNFKDVFGSERFRTLSKTQFAFTGALSSVTLNENLIDMSQFEDSDLSSVTLLKAVRGLREFISSALQNGRNEQDLSAINTANKYLRTIEKNANHLNHIIHSSSRSVLTKLSDYVQKRLFTLQNPSDCEMVDRLHCDLDNPNGFGASIHDIVWCLVNGLQRNLTVILTTDKWKHTPSSQPWENTFLPLSNCTNYKGALSGYPAYQEIQDRQNLTFLPSSIAPDLVRIHADPYAWFYGQIIGYIFRLQPHIQQKIDLFQNTTNFTSPIAGLHIRRTDKKSEASYRPLSAYVDVVEEYFRMKETTSMFSVPRRFYLATDDPEVFNNLRNEYPQCEILANLNSITTAHNTKDRSSANALYGIVQDLVLLSHTDFFVGTFSSGFSRVVYELRQFRDGFTAWETSYSLDTSFFFAYVSFPPLRFVENNEPIYEREMRSRVGQYVPPFASHYETLMYYINVGKHRKRKDGFEETPDLNQLYHQFQTVSSVRHRPYLALQDEFVH